MGAAIYAFRTAGAAWRGVAWVNEKGILDEKFTVLMRSLEGDEGWVAVRSVGVVVGVTVSWALR